MSDADEAPETDPLAETVAPPQPSSDERSPSKHALHQRVRARLFEGAPPAEYEAGTMLAGRFRVVGLLGRGGMGEVYRARDLVLDEDVAIKFIPQELAHDKRFMERFVQEVRLARVVSHPNVCRVHDIGELDGRSYLSMEYIDGEDLASLLRRIGRLPAEKATELARQLCAGLAALHEHEILHRDLKPHNLMVDGRGQLKITDFGLAAQGHVADNELRDGTPAYMAPEQAAGREVTVRSDLFALGLILYEIFTGDRARAKGRDDSALSSELTSRSGNMPPEVIAVIEACLRAEPSARPNSALSVAAALPGGDPVAAALAAGRAPSVDALLNTDAGGALPRLWGTAIAAVAVVLLIVVAATFESTTYLGRSPSLSPEVLRHEASELLDASTGPLDRPREYRAMRFDRNVMETRRQDPDGAPLVLFDYRRQAVPFQPLHVLSITDPPYVAPGAARVTLDGNGQLRSLFVGDVRKQDDPTTMDWTPLFEAAGLESATLQPIEPRDISERDVDDVRAWQGTHPTWNAEVRIEAGSRQGRVVVFDVIPQWDPRYEDAASVTTQQPEGPGLISLFVVVLFGGLAWMARRAARDHGADTRSAFRITVAVGIVVMLSLVLDRNLVDGNDHRFVPRVVALLGSLLTTYWGYVALEPFARRFHPEAMTAWVRLVRGRVRDALVGRAVLLGASASIVAAALERLGSSIDGDLALYPATINTLDSLYTMVNAIAGPTAAAPILFIFYIGLIRLVRNRAVASWIFVGIIVALFGAASYVGSGGGIGMTVGGAIAGGLWGLSIVRLGVLGLLSFQVVRNGVALLPMSLDFSAWFAPFSIAAMATILGLIVYGWRFGVAQSQPTST